MKWTNRQLIDYLQIEHRRRKVEVGFETEGGDTMIEEDTPTLLTEGGDTLTAESGNLLE